MRRNRGSASQPLQVNPADVSGCTYRPGGGVCAALAH